MDQSVHRRRKRVRPKSLQRHEFWCLDPAVAGQSAKGITELQVLKAQGYITTVGQVDAGVWGCSVPVFASGRRAVAALSLMAPHQRVHNQQAQLVQATLAAAARISRSLAG